MDNLFLESLAYIKVEIMMLILGLIVLMMGVFNKKCAFSISLKASFVFLSFLFIYTLMSSSNISQEIIFNDGFVVNSITQFIKIFMIFILLLVLMKSSSYQERKAEIFPLMIFSVLGGMVIVSSNDLLVFYLGIELQSLAIYGLVSLNNKNKRSVESGLKYFILGSLSSAIILFGISYIYGSTGSINFMDINELEKVQSIMFIFGSVLVLVGIFFKLAVFPFHIWSPDVYEGAEITTTSFIATLPKISIITFLVHFFLYPLNIYKDNFNNILLCAGILSILIGALGAMYQKSLKRIIAYSSINHMGFIIIAFVGLEMSITPVFTYIIAYSIITVSIFAMIIIIAQKTNNNPNELMINNISGLSKYCPAITIIFTLFLLSLAGIPPFAGFWTKFLVIKSVLSTHNYIFSILIIISSVISAFYYLRLIKIMYFENNENLNISNNTIALNSKVIILIGIIVNLLFVFFMPHLEIIFNI